VRRIARIAAIRLMQPSAHGAIFIQQADHHAFHTTLQLPADPVKIFK
jgi:hypothetical protein